MDTTGKITDFGKHLLESIPAGFLVFDNEYRVSFSNRNFELFGVADIEIEEGKDIRYGFFRKEFGVEKELEKMKDGVPFEIELKSQKTTDGGEISLILKGVPLMEDEFNGGVLLLEDLKVVSDARKSGEEILTGSNGFILDSALSLVILFNREMDIINLTGRLAPRVKRDSKKNKSTKLSQLLGEDFSGYILSQLHSLDKQRSSPVISDQDFILHDETFHLRYTLIKLPQNKIQSELYCMVFEDITELQNTMIMQIKAIEELEHYQGLAERLEFAISVINDQGLIVHWNRGIESLLGFKKSEVFGKDFFRLTGQGDKNSASAIISELGKKSEVDTTTDFYTKLGELKKIRFSYKFLSLSGDEMQISVLAADVSGEEMRAKALKSSLTEHSALTAMSPNPICFYDDNFRINYVNPAFEEYCALTSDKLIGEQVWRVLTGKNLVRNIKSAREFYLLPKKNEPVTILNKSSESERHGTLNITECRTDATKNYCLSFEDLTEVKAVSSELKTMKTIFTASSDGMALESEGIFIAVNESFARLFGFERGEELTGKNISEIIPSMENADGVTGAGSTSGEGVYRRKFSFPFVKKGGETIYIELVQNRQEIAGKVQVVLVARDITVEKIAEEKLKDSEIRYRSLTENLDDFFWIAERSQRNMRVSFYTESVVKITGYDSESLLSDSKSFLKLIHPDDFSQLKLKLKRFYHNYYKSADEVEFRIINKHGNVVWVRNKMNAVREKRGGIQKLYGLVTDISAQKRAEEVTKESTLNLQKLNETKDRFISIISHDLRTPFSSMLGFTDLLLSDDSLSEQERKQYIGYIADASKSMLSMVNSLLDWTRLQTGRINFEPDRVNLSQLVDKSIVSLRGYALKKGIDIVNETPVEINAFIDEGLIMQALNNLISNSLKFTSENGFIKISARQSTQPRFIEVSVKDNGVGIKAENLSKMFKVDTKFTTVGTGGEKGTGLGLSLVQEIIIKHGGNIRVESEYGKGADFIFTLPKASATILLIDDSNTDKILYGKIIRGIAPDYNILNASNGKEGLDLALKYSPALIITDHIMPVMSGFEFIKTYYEKESQGKAPVIVLSADLKKNEGLIYNDLGVEYVFTKPVNLVSFKTAVENCLKKLVT